MEFRTIVELRGEGDIPAFVKISVAHFDPSKEVRKIIDKAADEIIEQMTREYHAANPNSLARAEDEKRKLLACFEGYAIFARPIPNGYCSKACCAHFPWWEVTTSRGIIIIGWRKRVISLNWNDIKFAPTAEELFPDQNVTKCDRIIHAWGYEDAKNYIDRIIERS